MTWIINTNLNRWWICQVKLALPWSNPRLKLALPSIALNLEVPKGITKRIYTDKLDLVPDSVLFEKNDNKPEISFVWNQTDKHTEKVNQKVELFSIVNVRLSKHDNDPLKINVAMIKLLQIFYSEFYFIYIWFLLK